MQENNKTVYEQYTCPNCGGSISFDAKSQKLKCPYCSTEFTIDQLEIYKKISNDKSIDNIKWQDEETEKFNTKENQDISQYICMSCGAQIVTKKDTIATKCPYCDNPIVIVEKMKESYKPDFVIPFKIDEKGAKEAYKKHIKGKKFVPNDFFEKNNIEKIKSVYAPFWLYSGVAEASANFIATKILYYSDSNYDYTDTSFYALIRKGKFCFKNLPVDGSKEIDDILMESIEPYMDKDLKKFNTAYLAGYLAERYDQSSEKCQERAQNRAKNMADEIIKQSVTGYNTVTEKSSHIKVDGESPKYALLPVYILNTKYEDEVYTFAMNGQSGKFIGNLPIDKKKVIIYFIKIWFISSIILFFILNIIYFLYLNL